MYSTGTCVHSLFKVQVSLEVLVVLDGYTTVTGSPILDPSGTLHIGWWIKDRSVKGFSSLHGLQSERRYLSCISEAMPVNPTLKVLCVSNTPLCSAYNQCLGTCFVFCVHRKAGQPGTIPLGHGDWYC